MKNSALRVVALLLVLLVAAGATGSAYDGQPKLVVIVIIDQFRGDYLERIHGQLVENGFRLFTDRGANFTNCNYDYANTETGPGHATLLTGTYSNGHGIFANDWWDPARNKTKLSPVALDPSVKMVGMTGDGYSPRALLSDTLGDELKLSTDNKSRVFAISLKARSSVLPGGFAANAAYWINQSNGQWVTSTYYMSALPQWVAAYNASGKSDAFWNRQWKDAAGQVMRDTNKPAKSTDSDWYEIVGKTPLANDHELDFARQLIEHEKLGEGPATDLLVISLSANDILGHAVGPNSPQMTAMFSALDRQLSDFVGYLGQRLGLANVWLALSSDHGVSPAPAYATQLRLPANDLRGKKTGEQLDAILNARFSPGKNAKYIRSFSVTHVFLNDESFKAANVSEADAEHAVGEALKQVGMRGYYTRTQLEAGQVPPDKEGVQYLHSYSPYGGWYVLSVPPPFTMTLWEGGATTHGTAYFYDTHVPLAFYGLPFQPGTYRTHCEPVDMVSTLSSLLGINAPARAAGRVLTEAVRQSGRSSE